jgi:hypothetical protein
MVILVLVAVVAIGAVTFFNSASPSLNDVAGQINNPGPGVTSVTTPATAVTSNTSVTTPVTNVTEGAAATTMATSEFAADLVAYDSYFSSWSTSSIITVGQEICNFFNEGDSVDYVVGAIEVSNASLGNPMTQSQEGGLIGRAVHDLCPQYESLVQAAAG